MLKFSVHDPDKYKGRIKTNFYIRFEDGLYEGVEFTADNYRIVEGITPKVNYDLDILYSPPTLTEVEQPDFDNAVGEIITTILSKIIEDNGEVTEEIDEDLGEARIEELERDVIV
jgi:hypothetical protein